MTKFKSFYFYIFFTFLFIAFCFWIPDSGYDKYFWISWSKQISENGVGNIYANPEVNNFPLVIYLLKIFTLFFSSDYIDVFSINYLKVLVILFDFFTLGLVVWLLEKQKKNLLFCLFLLLNPAFWYNTIVWGQVDTIPVFFVFASLVFATEKKTFPALFFLLLAVNTKLQAVIFLPIILILVKESFTTKALRTLSFTKIGLLAVVQVLIVLPFIISGNFQQTIHALVKSSVDFYPTLSRNAYNFWYLFFDDPLNTSDQISFLLPAKLWGLILFVLFYVFIIFLFLKTEKKLSHIFLVCSLVVLGFFFFNTQMHERYIHAIVLLSGLYAMFSKRYLLFSISSFAYLLNLEAVMQMFSYFDDEIFGFILNYKTGFVLNPVFISFLFLLAIIIGIIDLFSRNNVKHN